MMGTDSFVRRFASRQLYLGFPLQERGGFVHDQGSHPALRGAVVPLCSELLADLQIWRESYADPTAPCQTLPALIKRDSWQSASFEHIEPGHQKLQNGGILLLTLHQRNAITGQCLGQGVTVDKKYLHDVKWDSPFSSLTYLV